MRRHLLAFVLVALPLASALGIAQSPPPLPSSGGSGVDVHSMDRSIDACNHFYQFACGGWMAANPLPAGRPRFDRFTELEKRNFAILRRISKAGRRRRPEEGARFTIRRPTLDR
jgi:hypothetical protein